MSATTSETATADKSPVAASRGNTIYFISDLHLDASRADICEAFRRFILETAANAHSIYILGDFFNAWIGDDNRSPLIDEIKDLLRQSTSRGTHIYFIHGNRDFLIGKAFAADTGVKILAENTLIRLQDEEVLLLHGDSLCTSDVDYQRFRQKVRNPDWQRKMLAYPLLIRKAIAAYFRARSRKINANKAENIMDVEVKTVEGAFRAFNVKKMIHGHTHRPMRHQHTVDGTVCERIVLGDWDTKGWFLKSDENGLSLVEFPL